MPIYQLSRKIINPSQKPWGYVPLPPFYHSIEQVLFLSPGQVELEIDHQIVSQGGTQYLPNSFNLTFTAPAYETETEYVAGV